MKRLIDSLSPTAWVLVLVLVLFVGAGFIGAATNFGDLFPNADNSYDLGSASSPTLEWKDIYIDGTAYIDSAVVDNSNEICSLTFPLTRTSMTDDWAKFTAIRGIQVERMDLYVPGAVSGGTVGITLTSSGNGSNITMELTSLGYLLTASTTSNLFVDAASTVTLSSFAASGVSGGENGFVTIQYSND